MYSLLFAGAFIGQKPDFLAALDRYRGQPTDALRARFYKQAGKIRFLELHFSVRSPYPFCWTLLLFWFNSDIILMNTGCLVDYNVSYQ
jgi:hypothetical protein